MSGNQVSIGSSNGLLPIRRQAIVWTNAGLLSIWPFGTNFSEFFYQYTNLFIHENAYENIVCKMASILSTGRWVKVNTWMSYYTSQEIKDVITNACPDLN